MSTTAICDICKTKIEGSGQLLRSISDEVFQYLPANKDIKVEEICFECEYELKSAFNHAEKYVKYALKGRIIRWFLLKALERRKP